MNKYHDCCLLVKRLLLVLDKVTESEFKIVDETYLEKLLTSIRNELDKNGNKHIQAVSFLEKFESIMSSWRNNTPDPVISGFLLRFVGTLARNEKEFQAIQNVKIVDKLLHGLEKHLFVTLCGKSSYILLLRDLISHPTGVGWIKDRKAWKDVIKLYLTDDSMYIERNGMKFVTDFVSANSNDLETNQDVIREILLPIITNTTWTGGPMVNEHVLHKNIGPSLKLLCSLLEIAALSPVKLFSLDIFDLHSQFKSLINSCESEMLLDQVATTYVSMMVVELNQATMDIEPINQLPECVVTLLKLLLKRGKICTMLCASKNCQELWRKIILAMGPRSYFCSEVEMHFIIFQMIPILMFIKRTSEINHFLELYTHKLASLISEETIRLVYNIRDEIQAKEGTNIAAYSTKGVLALTKNVADLNRDMALVIFPGLMYVLKEFTPNACEEDAPMTEEEYEEANRLCLYAPNLLSAILNALCSLISSFNINWAEAFESLCTLKFSAILLKNINLSTQLAVQVLDLTRLTIDHYLPPSQALLVNKIEDSSFECFGPLLYKRLHDVHWEVRDSCLEVVFVISEQADMKYPAFQQMLIDTNICELVVIMMVDDPESYVRASALRALSAMVKVRRLWCELLCDLDVLTKAIHILRTDTEGIVRREAAWLLKEIYTHQTITVETMATVYEVMTLAAIHDLHWEVKVNALYFWEKVIEKLVQDQGMIDGGFPSITFSKEHKKIMALTGDEIKLRLNKVLSDLSNTGCLYVLMTALNDDCDYKVAHTATIIIKNLFTLLSRYDIIKPHENTNCSHKRKTSDDSCCEKRKPVDTSDTVDCCWMQTDTKTSDSVIEDIVNDLDINLLLGVTRTNTHQVCRESGEMTIKTLPPQVFLDKLQSLNLNEVLEEKSKWLMDVQEDLCTLMDDILLIHSKCDSNILDCY